MEKLKTRKWYPVADINSIPIREGRRVNFKDYEIALFNLGTEFIAIDNRCPHKEGPLADGIVSGKSVFCPLHNWKISLLTGCALTGGNGHVKKYHVKTLEDKIYIAFDEGQLCTPEDQTCSVIQNESQDVN